MHTDLKKTAVTFRRWRMENDSPRATAPLDLQRQVVKLLEAHSWDEVCQSVGISRSRLGQWRKEHYVELDLKPRKQVRRGRRGKKPPQTKPTKPTHPAGFIEIAPLAPPAGLEVELRLGSGAVVHARSGNDAQALGDFIARVLAGASA